MNSKAMTSFIVGIMSIFIPLVGMILGIMGILYANRGLKEIEVTGEDGRTYALAGKTCSAIGLAIQGVIFIIALISYFLFSSFHQIFP
ncbi:DUF4190 domain-containing protein [Halobacillus litoralis]|uniref:DUF4190 domain-containing protein n=1 Tax=Halobacillus litoralis TaxID=45668 RepID=UPI001CD1F004|nr:DUF4190 domain-containing protein [Halobacillus litoralis]MCA0971987.1 DUF4190 domain-containing protein [Halobacillus litoralis]